MLKFHRHFAAAGLTALGLMLANASPQAAEGDGLTRAEVLQDLQQARSSNRLTPAGEIGDTPEVLAAREAFYASQTAALQAEREQAEQALTKTQALDELVAHLLARDFEDDSAALASID